MCVFFSQEEIYHKWGIENKENGDSVLLKGTSTGRKEKRRLGELEKRPRGRKKQHL
jgi:hypothetical protein